MLMARYFNGNELLMHERLLLAVQCHLQKLLFFQEGSITFLKQLGHHKDNTPFQESLFSSFLLMEALHC